MKATYSFDQIAHFRLLLEQKEVSPVLLQEFYDSGLLANLLEVREPKNLNRDAVREVFGLAPQNPPMPPLLEEVGTIVIPATTGQFVARKEFVLNYGSNAKPGLRIVYVDPELLDVIEEPVAEATLRYWRLTRPSLDGPILAGFGNRPDLAILLRQIHWLMKRQPNGESGPLLTNGRVNIFYLLGLLRAVGVYWGSASGGWLVGAISATHPVEWSDGFRVFSRNSSVALAV